MSIIDKKRILTKKPSSPRFDFSHPIVSGISSFYAKPTAGGKGAASLLAFDRNRGALPYNDAKGDSWAADTTNGTEAYKYQSVDGIMQFARQDIDEAGICYDSPDAGVGVNPNSTATFMFVGYTILKAPTASNRAIFSIQNQTRHNNPSFNAHSNGTTAMRIWGPGDAYQYDFPINVGKKSYFLYRFDGVDNHWFYDSNNGQWKEVTATQNNAGTDSHFTLGSGFQVELPVSFEFFMGSFGYVPTIAECMNLVKNPYQIFESKTQTIFFEDAVAAGFQPAWARNQTSMIGAR